MPNRKVNMSSVHTLFKLEFFSLQIGMANVEQSKIKSKPECPHLKTVIDAQFVIETFLGKIMPYILVRIMGLGLQTFGYIKKTGVFPAEV